MLSAVSLAFPAVGGRVLACGLEDSNDAVTRELLSTAESWGKRKEPGFFHAMGCPLILMQRFSPEDKSLMD